jgi:hypothetical protein
MKKNTILLAAVAAVVFYFATKKPDIVDVDPVDDTLLDGDGNYIAGLRGCRSCRPSITQYASI